MLAQCNDTDRVVAGWLPYSVVCESEMNDPREISLRIAMAKGIGPATYRRMRDRFGDHAAIMNASVHELEEVQGVGRARAQSIRRDLDTLDVASEVARMEDFDVSLIMYGDSTYPPLLAAIPDPPVALWVRGSLQNEAGDEPLGIAIVGSRRCTAYGREQANRFAALLASSGLAVISGGARGVDGEAHRGALRARGRTFSVLGCGLAVTYPPEHEDLFKRIVAQGGALISEYPMNTEPRREHFPRRNRIISGLSLGVLVIEAGKGSGALITARQAMEDHGRDVMCLPGRIDSAASIGCLEAVRDGWATLVLDHADVLRQLDGARHLVAGAYEAQDREVKQSNASLFDGQLSDDQRAIVDVVANAGGEAVDIDRIAAETQRPIAELMADLTILQIRNVLARDTRGVKLGRATHRDET